MIINIFFHYRLMRRLRRLRWLKMMVWKVSAFPWVSLLDLSLFERIVGIFELLVPIFCHMIAVHPYLADPNPMLDLLEANRLFMDRSEELYDALMDCHCQPLDPCSETPDSDAFSPGDMDYPLCHGTLSFSWDGQYC